MTVLLTGGAGFIGANVADRLGAGPGLRAWSTRRTAAARARPTSTSSITRAPSGCARSSSACRASTARGSTATRTRVAWHPHVAPREHPSFYGSSRLTLNLTRAAMAACGFCPSARLFEAAACRAVVVSDPWPGLEQFFERHREILVADTPDDVVRALHMPGAALRRVARRARARVLAEHTARHRALELVRLLS